MAPAPKVLGSDIKTHLKSRFCLQAILKKGGAMLECEIDGPDQCRTLLAPAFKCFPMNTIAEKVTMIGAPLYIYGRQKARTYRDEEGGRRVCGWGRTHVTTGPPLLNFSAACSPSCSFCFVSRSGRFEFGPEAPSSPASIIWVCTTFAEYLMCQKIEWRPIVS